MSEDSGSNPETASTSTAFADKKSISSGDSEALEHRFGMELPELYRHSMRFYKDNEGKSVVLDYNDKLKLVAMSQQALHGPMDKANLPDLGVLDVIGRDRRNAWSKLGQMTKSEAMSEFVEMVSMKMPQYSTYLDTMKQQELDKCLQE